MLEEVVQKEGLKKIITPDLRKIKSAKDHLLKLITNLSDPSETDTQKNTATTEMTKGFSA